jgi:hypothetical protein
VQDGGSEAVALIPAARCGECHGKMETEWRASAHARAERSPLYRAMRSAAPEAGCDRCHAPLRAVSPSDPAASEGVSCDVCHTIASVQPGRGGGAGFVLRVEDNVRYGPLCDARPHYFHAMGCSPLHEEGLFCAACHDWSTELSSGGRLVIFPEYAEWRADSPAGESISCQRCHMPGERSEVAVGSPERPMVPSHTFAGRGDLKRRALSGHARVTQSEGKLQVSVSLTNSGAGHSVPTGLPEHQIAIAVEILDKAGRAVAREEHTYGRLLVDAAGRAVPFYAAVRQIADTRLRAGESRSHSFVLEPVPAGRLRVSVVWRPIAAALAAQLGVGPLADEPMLAASLPLPVPRKRTADEGVLELRP